MDRRLNGLYPLSYTGVNPTTPPQLVVNMKRAPTINDTKFSLGDIWLDDGVNPQQIYMLTSLIGNRATWVLIYPQAAMGGGITTIHTPDGNNVVPTGGGVVNLTQGANVNITGAVANSVAFNVTGTNHAVQVGNGGSGFTQVSGTDNTVLVGHTGADPAFGVVPAGALPGGGTITLNGTAPINVAGSPVALGGTATISLVGAVGVPNGGTGATTFTAHSVLVGEGVGPIVGVGPGTTGQILGGVTGADPQFYTLVQGANVTITTNAGAGTITIASTGGGSGASTFHTDAGDATAAANAITIHGGSNINTSGAGSTVTVNLNNNVTISGNYTTTGGDIFLPATNAAGTQGVIAWNLVGTIHTLGTRNMFVGGNAGNLGLTTANATDETGIGYAALASLTTGSENTAVGSEAGQAITSGFSNTIVGAIAMANATTASLSTAVGVAALNQVVSGNANTAIGFSALALTTGGFNTALGSQALTLLAGAGTQNIAIGVQAGNSYTTTESSNILIGNSGTIGDGNTIRIGTQGAGAGQQNNAYMAGVYGATVGGTNSIVFVDNTGKLGTNGGIVFHADSGTATTAGNAITIAGGLNINTTAAGSTVTINTNQNITITGNFQTTAGNVELPSTNAAATAGVITWNSVSTIHTLGTRNIFLGGNAGNFALTAGSAVDNTSVGYNTLLHVTTGSLNAIVGSQAGAAITTGSQNAVLGAGALQNSTTTVTSTAVGYQALNANITGVSNTAIGAQSLLDAIGSFNIGIGVQALSALAGLGGFNIAIGFQAGTNYTNLESSNITISNAGVLGESNTIRIGTQGTGSGQQNNTYIAGIYNAAVGATNAPVFIDNTGKLGTTGGSGGGVFSWVDVTGTTQAMAINTGYTANNAGLVTLTLPAVAAYGSVVRIAGKGAGGWLVAQNAGQSIRYNDLVTTVGVGGSLASTLQGNTVEILCSTANTGWTVLSGVGDLTVT